METCSQFQYPAALLPLREKSAIPNLYGAVWAPQSVWKW